jgi:hypothetical protein
MRGRGGQGPERRVVGQQESRDGDVSDTRFLVFLEASLDE